MVVTLDDNTIKKLGEVIASKITEAKNSPEPWINIKELSAKTGRSPRSIYRDVEERALPSIRGGRQLKFKLSEVEAWLRRR